ncbi:MAG: hydrogenase maturation nickel metallochaperone HypA, partial [Candidatus Cloacimonetes bacterium]|nr:hydrogenase maturation nickel metallochaperone HypA [Candidatus Cloacimonadota bacterium]
DEVFQMYFDLMKKEYKGFENAELIMEEKDVMVKCKKCNETFLIEDPIFICPNCESFDTEIIQGNELHIESMEGMK